MLYIFRADNAAYPHDSRANKGLYRHDSPADKRRYRQDHRANSLSPIYYLKFQLFALLPSTVKAAMLPASFYRTCL